MHQHLKPSCRLCLKDLTTMRLHLIPRVTLAAKAQHQKRSLFLLYLRLAYQVILN